MIVSSRTTLILGLCLFLFGILGLVLFEKTAGLVSPVFWGFVAMFSGICSVYHGFCRCIRVQRQA